MLTLLASLRLLKPSGTQSLKYNRTWAKRNTKEEWDRNPRFRVLRSEPRYPGQRHFNPCWCLSCCCGGTCSLKTGCEVIALYLIVIGCVYFAIPFLPRADSRVLHFLVETLLHEDTEEQLGILRQSYTLFLLNEIGCVLFFAVSGLFLMLGAILVEPWFCILYVVTSSGRIGYNILTCIMVTVLVGRSEKSSSLHYKLYLIYFTWIFGIISTGAHTYFTVCGYALLQQIRHDEYGKSKISCPKRCRRKKRTKSARKVCRTPSSREEASKLGSKTMLSETAISFLHKDK